MFIYFKEHVKIRVNSERKALWMYIHGEVLSKWQSFIFYIKFNIEYTYRQMHTWKASEQSKREAFSWESWCLPCGSYTVCTVCGFHLNTHTDGWNVSPAICLCASPTHRKCPRGRREVNEATLTQGQKM